MQDIIKMISRKVDDDYCILLIRKWIESIGTLKKEGIHNDRLGYGFFFDALIKQHNVTNIYGVKLDIAFTLDDNDILFGFQVAEIREGLYYELPEDSPLVHLFQEKFKKINFGDQRPKGKKKIFLKLKKRAFPPGLEPKGNAINEFLNYCGAHQIPNDW